MSKCPIMARMKEQYENRSKTFLTRKVPVIMRLDGKAFHTFTKNLVKPFDEGLINDMQETAIYLCQNIQGAKCAYTQSDEISILITDYDDIKTEAWFNYNVQKMVSVSASLATGIFNQLRFNRFVSDSITSQSTYDGFMDNHYDESSKIFKDCPALANFDSRVFNIPKEEVNNYFIARQRDAVKNSISMLAQSLYSHQELHGMNQDQCQELCFQKGHNWNDLHFSKKRGSLIVKNTYVNGDKADIISDSYRVRQHEVSSDFELFDLLPTDVIRNKWELVETPTFSQDKIIESLI